MGTELKKEVLQIANLVSLPSHHRHVYIEIALTAHDDNCKCKSNCTPRLYCESRENLIHKVGKSERSVEKTIRFLVELGILNHLKRGRIGLTAEYELNTIEHIAFVNNKEHELQDGLYKRARTTKTKSTNYKVKEPVQQDAPNTSNTSNTKSYYRSANNVKERIHPPVKEVLIEEQNPATPEKIQEILSDAKALIGRT